MPEPEEWLKKLGKKLDERKLNLTEYDDYYSGRHKLAFATKKFKSAFGNLFSTFADNFCELVVDAEAERLKVQGFRLGEDRDDKDAWGIWQENALDSESQIAHTEALIKRECSALVWGNGERPIITIEDPLQMVVARSSYNRRLRLAALKRWVDDSGFLFATLYLPDNIYKFQSTKKVDPEVTFDLQSVTWDTREPDNEPWPLPNPLGEVPVIPLVNKPRLSGEGMSELAPVIPIQNAINKLVSDMLVASEFGAFRQRHATGIEVIDEETGEPMEAPFDAAADRLWVTPNENASFGEFSQTDLSNFVKAIEMHIQHVASITRTPPHYLLGQSGSFPSGESLKATETGLVAKARRQMLYFGESWEHVMRLAFKAMDDPRGKVEDSETLWADPESRTESEHVDALQKMASLGVPRQELWRRWGASPQEIRRWERMELQNALSQKPPLELVTDAERDEPQTA